MTAKAATKHVAAHVTAKVGGPKPAAAQKLVADDWKVISVGSVNVRVHVPTEVERKSASPKANPWRDA